MCKRRNSKGPSVAFSSPAGNDLVGIMEMPRTLDSNEQGSHPCSLRELE